MTDEMESAIERRVGEFAELWGRYMVCKAERKKAEGRFYKGWNGSFGAPGYESCKAEIERLRKEEREAYAEVAPFVENLGQKSKSAKKN